MTFDIHAVAAEDILELLKQPINKKEGDWTSSGKLSYVLNHPYSFSGFVGRDLIMCWGVIEYWPGRAAMWSLMGEKTAAHPVAAFRGIKNFVEEIQPYDRLEIDVPVDSGNAHHRARLLGFKLECLVAKKYSPTGEDRSLYAWVRN